MITLFAIQVGLARLWQSYGVEPAAVIGHSMGEVAAAVVAGALSLRDGVTVITCRARLPAGTAGDGAMAVLGLDPLRQRLGGIRPATSRIVFYTTALGDPRQAPAFDADYWAANLRNPVRLSEAVRAAAADGHRAFVEISAHPLLTHALTETVEDALVLSTLRGAPEGEEPADDTVTFHTRLAALKLTGLPVQLPGGGGVRDLPLPPWRHDHHWTRTRPSTRAGDAVR
jgi:phthiocerol/phenolphthiocerol synthesis type-I polyketide synthase D